MSFDDVTAVILSAGRGSRMGALCDDLPKCLVKINGKPLLRRQLDALRRAGIRDVVIVVGYRGDIVRSVVSGWTYPDIRIRFVSNDEWSVANYGISMLRAFSCVAQRCLLFHGDLVFSDDVLSGLLAGGGDSSFVVGSTTVPYGGKDFLARVDESGRVSAIGVGLFGSACVPSQPMYLLDAGFVRAWEASLTDAMSVADHRLRYAEDFLPRDRQLCLYDAGFDLVREVDCVEDIVDVTSHVALCDSLRTSVDFAGSFDDVCVPFAVEKAFVLTKRAVDVDALSSALSADVVVYSDFPRLPTSADCDCLLDLCAHVGCDGIVGIGAGSAIDTAKVVRAGFEKRYGVDVPLVVMPTLPGSGAEITPFASVWDGGHKSSLYGDRLVPDRIVYVDEFSGSTSSDIRYFGLLDICCHVIESSISRKCSGSSLVRRVLGLVDAKCVDYVNDASFWRDFHLASLGGGLCIAYDHTCIGHAMGYELTFKYGLPHGFASAICLQEVLSVSGLMPEFAEVLRRVLALREMDAPRIVGRCNSYELARDVNVERMSNFPVRFTEVELARMYEHIIRRWCVG